MSEDQTEQQIVEYLKKGNAHASLSTATEGVPAGDRCETVPELPYTLWELLEHIRIAQWDIVAFCEGPNHESPAFPEGYWPDQRTSVSSDEWEESLRQIRTDRDRMIQLVQDDSRHLTEPFPWGEGQTLLQEAQVIIDHRSYHTGQIIMLRRLLGNWDSEQQGISLEGGR